MRHARLYMFQCGTIRLKVSGIWKDQGGDVLVDVPVPWFVIEHQNGTVVVDGGNARQVATDPMGHWGPIAEACVPDMQEKDFCVDAMRATGIDPSSVSHVVLSHLHHDHTGAIGAFPDAVHVVRRAEYEYAFAPDWYMAPTYIRKDFDTPGLRWELLDGEGDIDLFGDGAVRLLSSPGHSAGHQSVMVSTAGSGKFLLAVDAVPALDHWNEKVVLGLTTSASKAVRSIARLRSMAERERATLVPGHDSQEWPRFQLAPDAYA